MALRASVFALVFALLATCLTAFTLGGLFRYAGSMVFSVAFLPSYILVFASYGVLGRSIETFVVSLTVQGVILWGLLGWLTGGLVLDSQKRAYGAASLLVGLGILAEDLCLAFSPGGQSLVWEAFEGPKIVAATAIGLWGMVGLALVWFGVRRCGICRRIGRMLRARRRGQGPGE